MTHGAHASLHAAGQGFHASADVALVATPLSVLDADLAFEVRGPAKSAAEAKKQQQKYSAAKEARRLLGGCGTLLAGVALAPEMALSLL